MLQSMGSQRISHDLVTEQQPPFNGIKFFKLPDYILCSQSWRSSIQSAKTIPGAECGSDHEFLIAKF